MSEKLNNGLLIALEYPWTAEGTALRNPRVGLGGSYYANRVCSITIAARISLIGSPS